MLLFEWKPGRSRDFFGSWSGLSESNRHLNLGKVPYYHYTKAARQERFPVQNIYNTPRRKPTSPLAWPTVFPRICPEKLYETCETRTDFTTGERRWRSANRVAFSLSVYTRPNFSPSA
jgi:hypothetical protein